MADPRDKKQDKDNKAHAGVNGVEQNTSRKQKSFGATYRSPYPKDKDGRQTVSLGRRG